MSKPTIYIKCITDEATPPDPTPPDLTPPESTPPDPLEDSLKNILVSKINYYHKSSSLQKVLKDFPYHNALCQDFEYLIMIN